MVCPHCSSNTQVINSRLQKRANSVWRRRKCTHCSATFTSREVADLSAAWRVLHQKTGLQPFLRDKLFLSLYKSLQHRPTALTDAGDLVDTIITQLIRAIPDSPLAPATIIQAATIVLGRFDTAAEVHYQAFHKL